MHTIDQLPNSEIKNTGTISKKFLELGVTDFHAACRWVQELSYGYNSSHDDPFIIFEEQRGICTTKHGAVALLAQENDLDVFKMLGFYKLNDTIVTGVNEILDRYGLSYIPQIHCFLCHQMKFVDLTEGNCHGKNRQLNEFDIIYKVKPDIREDEELEHYTMGLEYYQANDQKLASFSKEELISILKECNQKHKNVCSIK